VAQPGRIQLRNSLAPYEAPGHNYYLALGFQIKSLKQPESFITVAWHLHALEKASGGPPGMQSHQQGFGLDAVAPSPMGNVPWDAGER